MKTYCSSKRIVLIDHQPYWREISTNALRSSGFVVDICDTYNFLPEQEWEESENPDLVVLGCSGIRVEEQKLIDDVLAHNHHLLVLCTSLSWLTMRNLFLKGVHDIVDKPYNPASLVKIVNQTLESTHPGKKYQPKERQGAA